jgi:hypothetical protein
MCVQKFGRSWLVHRSGRQSVPKLGVCEKSPRTKSMHNFLLVGLLDSKIMTTLQAEPEMQRTSTGIVCTLSHENGPN